MGKLDIAPLRPPTLATFRSWGNSAGAGRINLPDCKNTTILFAGKRFHYLSCFFFELKWF